MGDYSYLPQQSEEHFAAHNRNDLEFIELNLLPSCLICFSVEEQSSRQFQDFWNWFLNEHSAETYTAYTIYYFDQAYFEDNFEEKNTSINQLLYSTTFEHQPPDFEYLNHQIHIWIAAHQLAENSFETEEEITLEPMAQDPMQANILAALQGIQTALGRKNNTSLPLFRGDAQDPIEWLDDFERAATANQYDDEYKFQIVGGYLQGSPATWFSQKTDANAHQRIIRWMPANAGENNTSFTTWFENKFRIPILISKWHMELERRTQGPGEIVTEYAKAIRKIKNQFILCSLASLGPERQSTMDMAIELAQRIKDNQRIHLGSTLPVFAPVPVMAPAPQMAAASFAAQTQDPNKQLIDRLIANLIWLLEPLTQAVRDNQQLQRPRYEPHFNQPQQPPYQDSKIVVFLYVIDVN
ncbi:hypothetical protein G9A89_020648 [Geosiphon pyriformis]|nr:hypothetical protein G9A89_020648 [Geosiphon pyriformis]